MAKFTLTRYEYGPQGIFGNLTSEDGRFHAHTLEHAYTDDDGNFVAKLNVGDHICKRGPHRLHGMTQDFETFEITGVPGHSNILFHWGNYNSSSDGCVLLGTSRAQYMVTASRSKFAEFMEYVGTVQSFSLTVQEENKEAP